MRAMLSGTVLVCAALFVTACSPPIEPEEMDIFQASYSGETSRVQTLLERGADPDFKSQEGYLGISQDGYTLNVVPPCHVFIISRII